MICVEIDKEISQVFGGKMWGGEVEIGDVAYFNTEEHWWEKEDGCAIFPLCGEDEDDAVYDREFTEWVKENRPEIFI